MKLVGSLLVFSVCLLQSRLQAAYGSSCTAYNNACTNLVAGNVGNLISISFLADVCQDATTMSSTLCMNSEDLSQQDVDCVVEAIPNLFDKLACTLRAALAYFEGAGCTEQRTATPSYVRVSRCYKNLALRQLQENIELVTTNTQDLVGEDCTQESDQATAEASALPTTEQQCFDNLGWFLCGYYNGDQDDFDGPSITASKNCANSVFSAIAAVNSPAAIDLRGIPLSTIAADFGNLSAHIEACDSIEGVNASFFALGEPDPTNAGTKITISSCFTLLVAITMMFNLI
mmetsp:Transcript_3563/g.4482  ORF Transcript_3563/g.4482 Transcript_3563/m.4482 type:complete len:288 (+) Transcript_3563:327-1190(+)